MNKHRLVSCAFLCAGSFRNNVSNKGKLLYYQMLVSADDRGFVDTTNDIIKCLTDNDLEFDKSISLELLENTYTSALNELIDKGYLLEFIDNHQNKIHLIRHFFIHNKYAKGLWTNYKKFLDEVELKDYEYVRKPIIKESNIKQDNIKQDNITLSNELTGLDEVIESEINNEDETLSWDEMLKELEDATSKGDLDND